MVVMGCTKTGVFIVDEPRRAVRKVWLWRAIGIGLLAGWGYFVILPSFNSLIEDCESNERINTVYQRMPLEIKQYDLDGNRSLDGQELEDLMRDYRLEKR